MPESERSGTRHLQPLLQPFPRAIADAGPRDLSAGHARGSEKTSEEKECSGEEAVSDEYLEEVVKAYEHFFFHYTSSDLLIVNTSDIDFVDRNEDLQELLRKVTEPIKGTQYFLPLGGQDAASA